MQLYSINKLAKNGISTNILRKWLKDGTLKPFTYAGEVPKFRETDFLDACETEKKNRESDIEKLIINL